MIGYTVSIEGLAELEMDLEMSKDKTKNILRAAINNTAKKVENQMTKEAGKRYTLEGGWKSYRKVNKIEKARVNKLYATITASSRPADTYRFTVSPKTYFRGGVGAPDKVNSFIKAKTLKGARLAKMARAPGAMPRSKKYKAFVVKYQNGHMAFAERVPGKAMKGNPHKEALQSLYGTTEAKGEEVVFKTKIDSTVYQTLSDQIRLQIPKFVK